MGMNKRHGVGGVDEIISLNIKNSQSENRLIGNQHVQTNNEENTSSALLVHPIAEGW